MKRSDVPNSEGSQGLPATATSLSLLARVRTGEQAGWQRLVKLYGPLVYSWCRQGGLSPEDASDAAQEVFSSVWKNVDRFRRENSGDSFRKWLKTIALNRARDFHRRDKRRPQAKGGTTAQIEMAAVPNQVPPGESPPTLDETPSQRAQEEAHLLRQATELVRGDFEPRTWQAFWQSAVEGRASADIAADLGITPNAVRIAKSRVKARLREEMDGLLD